jgi:hypothetical protein
MKRSLAVSLAMLAIFLVSGSFFSVGKTQSLPAPTVDRVGFPTGYQQGFIKVFTFDNYQSRQVLNMWANSTAASVTPDTVFKFPYGSVIVMESDAAAQDTTGEAYP